MNKIEGPVRRNGMWGKLFAFLLFILVATDGPLTWGADSGISIARDGGGGVVIRFDGLLQSAPSLGGPWTKVIGAQSPHAVATQGELTFYRSSQRPGIFDELSVVNFALRGPFQAHFDLAFAGLPDGIFPPVRSKPYFAGSLDLNGNTIPVRIRVRGNSSLQECPFPKLKVKVSRSDRVGTPFEFAREIKIGTHCADGGVGTIGRLRDDRAAYREALIYEVMDLLGFISPKVRRARIEYIDPLGASERWPVQRMAFIFEHVEVVAERLSGRALEDEEVAALSDAGFDTQLITDLKLFHALIGNWDYALSHSGEGLWNTEVIRLENGGLVPVAGDFDLAAWVTGETLVTAPRDFQPKLEDLKRELNFRLVTILAENGFSTLDRSRQHFLSRRAQIEGLVLEANTDDEGRQFIANHVAAFYEALEALEIQPDG